MRQFVIEGYPNPLIPLFSPCGRLLYGTGMTFIVAWDLTRPSTEPVWTDTESGAFLFRLIVSPCGRYLAGAEDRCVVVWDRTTGAEGKWIRANANGDHISDVAFTPKSTDLLTACLADGGIQRWRVGSWRRKPTFGKRANNDGALAVSPDGKTVATVDSSKGRDGTRIKLWNYPKGTHRKTSTGAAGNVVHLAFSPDGSLLAGKDDWKRVRVWDAKTLKPVAEYTPKPKTKKKAAEPVHAFAFHPSGRYLAVAGQPGPVEFVDTATWEPIVAYDWKQGSNYGVCFNPDGTLAAAGGAKGTIVVWDVDV